MVAVAWKRKGAVLLPASLAASAAWLGVTLSATEATLKTVPSFLIVGTAALLIIVERNWTHVEYLSPIVLSLAFYGLVFGVIPLVDVWFGNPATYHAAWPTVAWISWLGLLILYLGFRVGMAVPGRGDAPARDWLPGRARLAGVVLLTLAVGGATLQIGGVGGISGYIGRFSARRFLVGQQERVLILYAITLATPAFLLVAGNWVWQPTRRRLVTLCVVWLPPGMLLSGMLGQRVRALGLLATVMTLYHFRRRRIRLPALTVLVAGLAAAFVLVAVYRNVAGTGASPRPISGRLFYENYLAGPDFAYFRQFLTTFEGVPTHVSFQNGRTFLSLIPGTDFPTGGYVYSTTFAPAIYARGQGTSLSPSLPGELYMNFGLPGVFMGLLLYGLVHGRIERYFRSRRSTIPGLLIYSYLIVPMAGLLRGDFRTYGGWALLSLGVLAVALRFVMRPRSAIQQSSRSRLAPSDMIMARSH
ncbi:MAG: O-antigen polymerase [Actinomycetota bacterium]